MFFTEINEFRTLLQEIKKICLKNQEKITSVDAELEIMRKRLVFQGAKFEACSKGFEQIKLVCEELTERICEATGVISNLE